MTQSRNEVTQEEENLSQILRLSQSTQEGKTLGIGLCSLNPSGCFDIAKGISLQLQNAPYIRVHSKKDPSLDWTTVLLHEMYGLEIPRIYDFLDIPPKLSVTCDSVFFTGCCINFDSMTYILKSLQSNYGFNDIRYVYQIMPPHHPEVVENYKFLLNQKLRFSRITPYQYSFMFSGIDSSSPFNIGMPRFLSKSSEFEVPLECYGVIRHRQIGNFLPLENGKFSQDIEKYWNEYFRQVAYVGKDSLNKKIMVIAIGIKNKYQKGILEIANKYSVKVDFCDQFSANRLPYQEDFFKLLSIMKDRRGIASFDDTSTQCLLQALSFGAPVMIFSRGAWQEFYKQLVNLVPIEYQPTAQVVLGLDDNYDLFNDREKCQRVYEFLYLAAKAAHQKFDNFRDVSFELMVAANDGDLNALRELADKNVNFNQVRTDGLNPLMLAAKNGHQEAVEFLLKNDADAKQGLGLPDEVTPATIAEKKGYTNRGASKFTFFQIVPEESDQLSATKVSSPCANQTAIEAPLNDNEKDETGKLCL